MLCLPPLLTEYSSSYPLTLTLTAVPSVCNMRTRLALVTWYFTDKSRQIYYLYSYSNITAVSVMSVTNV